MIVALLILMFPAPRPLADAITLPGAFDLEWGACRQTTIFHADHTCTSPTMGPGTWGRDGRRHADRVHGAGRRLAVRDDRGPRG